MWNISYLTRAFGLAAIKSVKRWVSFSVKRLLIVPNANVELLS